MTNYRMPSALPFVLLVCWLGVPAAPAAVPEEDPLKINDDMVHFLETSVEHRGDALQQLRTLVHAVFEDNALNFTYESVTRTAIETFKERRGNCISFTLLFLALARQLGLDARFREVEIAPVWSQAGEFVTVGGHANVAILIGTQWYTVDLFPQVNRIEVRGSVVNDGRALAHFYNNRGVDYMAKNNPKSAIECFQKALGYDATLGGAWCNLGVAFNNTGLLAEAEKSYQEALRLDAGDMAAMNNLAALYKRMGRDREAKRWLDKARKFRELNPYFHYGQGSQDFESGNYRASVDHFKAAIKRKPSEHKFYLALARNYLKLGDLEKARDCLKSALKYAPDEGSKLLYSDKLNWLATHQPTS